LMSVAGSVLTTKMSNVKSGYDDHLQTPMIREFISPMYYSMFDTQQGAWSFKEELVHPLNSFLFPSLTGIARGYDEYQIDHLELVFESESSMEDNGSVSFSYEPVPSDGIYNVESEMTNGKYFKQAALTQRQSGLNVPLPAMHSITTGRRRLVPYALGELNNFEDRDHASTEVNLWATGRLYWAMSRCTNLSAGGKLFIRYRMTFFKKTWQNPINALVVKQNGAGTTKGDTLGVLTNFPSGYGAAHIKLNVSANSATGTDTNVFTFPVVGKYLMVCSSELTLTYVNSAPIILTPMKPLDSGSALSQTLPVIAEYRRTNFASSVTATYTDATTVTFAQAFISITSPYQRIGYHIASVQTTAVTAGGRVMFLPLDWSGDSTNPFALTDDMYQMKQLEAKEDQIRLQMSKAEEESKAQSERIRSLEEMLRKLTIPRSPVVCVDSSGRLTVEQS